MAAEQDKKFTVLFRAELPGGDVVEFIAWEEAPGGAVRVNGRIQEADGDPMEAFLRMKKARDGDGKA